METSAAELETARKRFQEAEKAHKTKQEAAAKVITLPLTCRSAILRYKFVLSQPQVVSELETVSSKISALKRDSDRATEAATLGQKSLVIARQQAVEARKLINPLNHPRVKAILGRK